MHEGTDWTKFVTFHPLYLTNFIYRISFQSSFNFAFLDCKCASTSREIGGYSTVTVIAWFRKYFHVFLANSIEYLFLVMTMSIPHLKLLVIC